MITKDEVKKRYLESIPSIIKEKVGQLSIDIQKAAEKGESTISTDCKDKLVAEGVVKELKANGYKVDYPGHYNDWTHAYHFKINWS